MNKQCKRCKESVDISLFGRLKSSSDGLYLICKKCTSEVNELVRRKRKANFKEEFDKDYKKKCFSCELEKTFKQFYIDKYSSDRLQGKCIDCSKQYAKENPPSREAKQKTDKKHYLKHREKILVTVKFYQENNKDKIKECLKLPSSRLRKREGDKRYRLKPETKAKTNERARKNRALYLEVRILNNLRSRIAKGLQGGVKSKKTKELLGSSIKELKVHLESKFAEGMSWENYGLHGWHIDHIRPCASFNLSDHKDQEVCFHYSNLQPLWAADNLRKGDKFA